MCIKLIIMLIKEEKFRNLYCKFIVLKSQDKAMEQERLFKIDTIDDIEVELDSIPVENNVNSILLCPYVDHTAGLSFLVVATAYIDGEYITINNRQNFEVLSTIRKGAVDDYEFVYAETLKINNDFDYETHFNYAGETLKHYRRNEELEASRMLDMIDESREDTYPDDILVFFFRDDLNPEGMWVRLESMTKDYLIGTLLNQPNQDFGVNQGDEIKVDVAKDGDGEFICVANLEDEQ